MATVPMMVVERSAEEKVSLFVIFIAAVPQSLPPPGGGWRSNKEQTTSDGFSVVSRGGRAKRTPSQDGNSAWRASNDDELNANDEGGDGNPKSAPAGPVIVSPEAVNYDAEDDEDNW